MIIRYILKKRFARGSYGEVWLAFHWNCHNGSDASKWSEKSKNISDSTILEESHTRNLQNGSNNDCHAGSSNDNLFILKRIMVSYSVDIIYY